MILRKLNSHFSDHQSHSPNPINDTYFSHSQKLILMQFSFLCTLEKKPFFKRHFFQRKFSDLSVELGLLTLLQFNDNFQQKKNTIQYKPTPMLSAVSWLCIYPLCDRRSSTWPSGQRTVWVNNVFLCKLVQIAPNWHCILWQILQLSLSLCLEIQVARLCTSMCRLRVIRSFPGSPGFTRIFT